MSGATPILGLPYPTLGDQADIETFGVKPLALALEPQAWQIIAWGGTAAFTASLRYYKDALGIVRCRGDILTASGTLSAGGTLGTLPAGYRPGTTQRFMVAKVTSGTPGLALVDITTGGVVTAVSSIAVSDTYSFSGIQFRAEN
jgi:hypothetical protein